MKKLNIYSIEYQIEKIQEEYTKNLIEIIKLNPQYSEKQLKEFNPWEYIGEHHSNDMLGKYAAALAKEIFEYHEMEAYHMQKMRDYINKKK